MLVCPLTYRASHAFRDPIDRPPPLDLVLRDATHLTVMESDRTFPSEAQASAAALAFSKLVTRAGKTLTAPTSGGLF